MKLARAIEGFVGDPIGRYTIGATHLVWCHSATLCGTAHWGRPGENDAAELVRRLEVSIHPKLGVGFDGFMDARGMESFDWPTFGVVSEYVKGRLEQWRRRIRRHAIVVPPGVAGVHVAGLLPLLGADHPIRLFSSVPEALAFIDREDLREVLDELGPIIDEARGVLPLVRALREYLDRSLADATLEATSRALALSTRSLQRELREQGTRFALELARARLRAACQMLEHSDEKVESIARRVGCASSSQLSAIFRQHLGETPARYRARRQPIGKD